MKLNKNSYLEFKASKIIIYEKYIRNKRDQNDLALVHLDRPLELVQDSVQPICLPPGVRARLRKINDHECAVFAILISKSNASLCKSFASQNRIFIHCYRFLLFIHLQSRFKDSDLSNAFVSGWGTLADKTCTTTDQAWANPHTFKKEDPTVFFKLDMFFKRGGLLKVANWKY